MSTWPDVAHSRHGISSASALVTTSKDGEFRTPRRLPRMSGYALSCPPCPIQFGTEPTRGLPRQSIGDLSPYVMTDAIGTHARTARCVEFPIRVRQFILGGVQLELKVVNPPL